MELYQTKINCFVLFDASFLISLMDQDNDPHHKQALTTFKIIQERKDSITYIFPLTVINETVFNLLRAGYEADLIKQRILKLSTMPRIIITNPEAISVLRFLSDDYNFLMLKNGEAGKQLPIIGKTNDYIIACSALDYNAVVVGGDRKMLRSLSNVGVRTFNFMNDYYDSLKDYIKEASK